QPRLMLLPLMPQRLVPRLAFPPQPERTHMANPLDNQAPVPHLRAMLRLASPLPNKQPLRLPHPATSSVTKHSKVPRARQLPSRVRRRPHSNRRQRSRRHLHNRRLQASQARLLHLSNLQSSQRIHSLRSSNLQSSNQLHSKCQRHSRRLVRSRKIHVLRLRSTSSLCATMHHKRMLSQRNRSSRSRKHRGKGQRRGRRILHLQNLRHLPQKPSRCRKHRRRKAPINWWSSCAIIGSSCALACPNAIRLPASCSPKRAFWDCAMTP